MTDQPTHTPSLWFALLGAWLVWSAPFGTTEPSVFPQLATFEDEVFVAHLVLVAAFLLSSLLLMLYGWIVRDVGAHPLGLLVATAATSIGMVFGSLPALGFPISLLSVGAAFRGIAGAIVVAAWIECLSNLEGWQAATALFYALALYGLLGVLVPPLAAASPFAALIVLALLPWAAFLACMQLTRTEKPRPRPTAASEPLSIVGWASFLASNLIYGFVFGIMLSFFSTQGAGGLYLSFAATALVAAGALLVVNRTQPLRSLHSLCRAFFLVGSSLLLVVTLLGSKGLIEVTVAALWTFQICFTFLIFTDVEYGLLDKPWFGGGFSLACASVGMFAALAISPLFTDPSLSSTVLIAATLTAMLYLAIVFLSGSNMRIGKWGFASFMHPESREAYLSRRCGELTAEYSLTPREFEILHLLSLGHTPDTISETLVISPYTAKTHIRNIYAKLDVHNKDELGNLIEHNDRIHIE